MSDEHDDERPDRTSDDSVDESPDESADESPDEPAEDAAEGEKVEAGSGPGGPAVLDMADLDALDDSDMSIEVEGLEVVEEEEEPEMAIDLSEFDAEPEDGSVLDAELDAARTQADELRREKQDAEAELATVRDHLRRTAADLENYRKRIERERKEEKKQAASGLVLKLLAITDNFQRALEQGDKAAAENEVLAGFVEGVRLIETQFFDILSAAGLEPVDASGAFDPAVHEALMQEPSDEAPHLSILEVFEQGYLFGGRLLRPARVKVAHNPGAVAAPVGVESSDTAEAEDAETDEAADGGGADKSGSEAADDIAADEPKQDQE